MSIPVYVNIKSRAAHKNAFEATRLNDIDLRYGDKPVFNVYFMLPTRDPRAPYAVNRFQSATISMQLLDATRTAQATQGTWTEIVPSVTAPTITHNQAPSATKGLWDTITLASEPGSGSLALTLSGGTVAVSGAGSAMAKVYPGVTSEAEVAAAFAASIGAPYKIAFDGLTIIQIHGSAVTTAGATGPTITAVGVSNLQYLYGYTATLDLSGSGVQTYAEFDGNTPGIALIIKLTPSGGQAETVLNLPVNLFL